MNRAQRRAAFKATRQARKRDAKVRAVARDIGRRYGPAGVHLSPRVAEAIGLRLLADVPDEILSDLPAPEER